SDSPSSFPSPDGTLSTCRSRSRPATGSGRRGGSAPGSRRRTIRPSKSSKGGSERATALSLPRSWSPRWTALVQNLSAAGREVAAAAESLLYPELAEVVVEVAIPQHAPRAVGHASEGGMRRPLEVPRAQPG